MDVNSDAILFMCGLQALKRRYMNVCLEEVKFTLLFKRNYTFIQLECIHLMTAKTFLFFFDFYFK